MSVRFPWEVGFGLGLSDDVDQCKPVQRLICLFDFYRTYRGSFAWSAMYNNNAAFFVDNDVKNISVVFEQMVKRLKQRHGVKVKLDNKVGKQFLFKDKNYVDSVEIVFYDFYGAFKKMADVFVNDEWGKECFRYVHYSGGFEKFVNEFIVLRDSLRGKARDVGKVEFNTRKIVFPVFFVSDADVALLRRKSFFEDFVSFFSDSTFERFYPVLIANDASVLPEDFFDFVEWSAFLGEDNLSYANDVLYPDFKIGRESLYQDLIGYGYTRFNDESKVLVPLYPRKFTPNDFFLGLDKAFRDEDAAYEAYLDSLYDGS